MHIFAVTLPEPVRLREFNAREEANLSDFQEGLVHLAAVLNGEHKEEIYPRKLVEGMMVSQAARYVEDAFQKFVEECEKARESGVDESEVFVFPKLPTNSTSKNFIEKLFSCLICDH